MRFSMKEMLVCLVWWEEMHVRLKRGMRRVILIMMLLITRCVMMFIVMVLGWR